MPLSWSRTAALLTLLAVPRVASADVRDEVRARIAADYPSLRLLYEQLHAHPELSFMEVNTAAVMAKELRALGVDVTEKVGRMGVVGVLRNGPGPTVLLRTDMDALVVAVRARWSGTMVFIAQPAEEIVAGAKAMLDDGLYTRFPKPDFALTFHDDALMPAGQIGYREGPFMSGVSSMDILVRGVGERAHRRTGALESQFGLRAPARTDHRRRRHDDDGHGARSAGETVSRPCRN